MKEELKKVIELLGKEENWCQENYALNKDGLVTSAFSSNAIKFCMTGAILRITNNAVTPLYRYLRKELDQNIEFFNDSHSYEEVMTALRKALAKLENETL